MSIDISGLKVSSVTAGSRSSLYGAHWVEVDLDDAELVECIDPDAIVETYGANVLLDAIGEEAVMAWMEGK